MCNERGEARGWEKRELLASFLLKAVKNGKGTYFIFYFPYFGAFDRIQMLICA